MSGAKTEISLSALAHNAIALEKTVGSYYAVLKCNAYGHGAQRCARLLYDIGIRHFAVYSLDLAIKIKKYLPLCDILILGRTPVKYADELLSCGFIQTVFSDEYANELAPFSKGIRVHLKLDLGMNRAGFKCDSEELLRQISAFKGEIEGVYTHFHCADCPDLSFTETQLDGFLKRSSELEAMLGRKLQRHAAASAAALRLPRARLDISRIGLALYGVLPDNCEGLCELKPVMSFFAPITGVRFVKKGENVGYGCDVRAKRDTVCATVSAGYANGLTRIQATAGRALVHGKRVSFLGRICMDRCMLDVTDLAESGISVKPYDTALFFGNEISVSEFAEYENTIPYEILTRVGKMCKE